MPKITDISPQSKKKNRVSVYLDGKYAFGLSLWQLGDLKLSIGDELNPSQVKDLKKGSELGKLYDRLLIWLSLRPRSEWEIRDYLARKTKDEQLIELAIEKAKAGGYVDDSNFAERWVNNRRLLKPMSTLKLKQELIKKRVPKEIIEQTLADDATSDIQTIKKLIAKVAHRYKDEQKLMGYLARQGYNYSTIKDALREIAEEEA